MYNNIRDDWYFREDPKRRTFVFHGKGNTGKSEAIAILKKIMHVFEYFETQGCFNRKFFRSEFKHQCVAMNEGAKKLLFKKGNEGICKSFMEGLGMPWE